MPVCRARRKPFFIQIALPALSAIVVAQAAPASPDERELPGAASPTWQKYTDAGARAFANRDMELAERYFRMALGEAEKLDPKGRLKVDGIMNIAEIYYSVASWDEAQQMYEQALDLARKLDDADPRLVVSLANLGDVFFAQKRWGEAEKFYKEAVDAGEKLGDKARSELASADNDLANLYFATGRYAQAEPLYLQALALRTAVDGAQADKTADIANNLGILYATMRRYPEAEAKLKEALAVKSKLHGQESPQAVECMEHLGEVYRKEGNLDAAEAILLQALTIERKTSPENLEAASVTAATLARVYRDNGKSAKAKELLEKIVAAGATNSTLDPASLAQSQYDLARMLDAGNDFRGAEDLLARSLDIKRKLFGKNDPRVVFAMQELAEKYRSHEQWDDAAFLLKQLAAMASGPVSDDEIAPTVDLALVYEDLGELYLAKHLPDEARKYFQQELTAAKADSEAARRAELHISALDRSSGIPIAAPAQASSAEQTARADDLNTLNPVHSRRSRANPLFAQTGTARGGTGSATNPL